MFRVLMPFLGFNYGESKGLERVLSARIKMGTVGNLKKKAALSNCHFSLGFMR